MKETTTLSLEHLDEERSCSSWKNIQSRLQNQLPRQEDKNKHSTLPHILYFKNHTYLVRCYSFIYFLHISPWVMSQNGYKKSASEKPRLQLPPQQSLIPPLKVRVLGCTSQFEPQLIQSTSKPGHIWAGVGGRVALSTGASTGPSTMQTTAAWHQCTCSWAD